MGTGTATKLETTKGLRRRGAEAVELALIMPVLLAMIFGALDYGWYFFQQSLATNAVMDGMRAGGMILPADAELGNGTCMECINVAASTASDELAAWGIIVSPQDLKPTLNGVAGVCTMTLITDIPYQKLIGFVPVPDGFSVTVALAAQAVKGC
jgi:hypothetical protein